MLLCLAIVVLASCSTVQAGRQSSGPALPKGWTAYHDPQQPIVAPTPPGWLVGAYTDGPMTDETCAYDVDTLPNGLVQHIGTDDTLAPELIYVRLNLKRQPWSLSNDPHFVPLGKTIMVSGVPATLYNNNDGQGDLQRLITLTLGGHQWIIGVQANAQIAGAPHDVQRDLDLYMQFLASFRYN